MLTNDLAWYAAPATKWHLCIDIGCNDLKEHDTICGRKVKIRRQKNRLVSQSLRAQPPFDVCSDCREALWKELAQLTWIISHWQDVSMIPVAQPE